MFLAGVFVSFRANTYTKTTCEMIRVSIAANEIQAMNDHVAGPPAFAFVGSIYVFACFACFAFFTFFACFACFAVFAVFAFFTFFALGELQSNLRISFINSLYGGTSRTRWWNRGGVDN